MSVKQNIFASTRALWAGALLLLFCAYYANVTLFSHYHIVDGVTIVHSHFYSDDHTSSPDNNSHTKSEITLIKAISNYTVELQNSIIFVSFVMITAYTIYYMGVEQRSIKNSYSSKQLRAPPAALLIG